MRDELHTFIRHGYAEGVIKLAEREPLLVTAKNTKGRCSLHTAVLMGNLEIIELLIEANRRAVNTPDNVRDKLSLNCLNFHYFFLNLF
jgi:hypothetical protein